MRYAKHFKSAYVHIYLEFSTKSYYNSIKYDFVLFAINQTGRKMTVNTHSSKDLKRFNYLARELDAAYHEINVKLKISDSTMLILYAICDHGDSCPLRDIYYQFGISKQTINSALRKLEEEGVVFLEAVDAKNKRVCLTSKGKDVADRTAKRIIEMKNDIFSSWTEEDVEKYLELTERYVHDFRERSGKLT